MEEALLFDKEMQTRMLRSKNLPLPQASSPLEICWLFRMELRRNARFRPAVHKLKIDPNVQPVKQAPRRMRIELEEKVVIETKKLIEAGFIQEEENPDWVASIVPVKKKNGQIRICVDFRDLNKACPKDEFSLPVTEHTMVKD